MTVEIGYYVDEGSGRVCSTDTVPPGCHFEYQDADGYRLLQIVKNSDGEVLQEVVLWPSLEAMAAAGVDVAGYIPASQPEKIEV